MNGVSKVSDLLFDRRLCAAREVAPASFQEQRVESQNGVTRALACLEGDLLRVVRKRNVEREASGERNCGFDRADLIVVGGFEFYHNPEECVFIHESGDLTIRLEWTTFLAEAEETLGVIFDEREWLPAPATIRIGISPFIDSWVAAYNAGTGNVAIYGEHRRSGGLCLVGLAAATKGDAVPISLRRVLIHELTHGAVNGELQETPAPRAEGNAREVLKTRPAPDFSGTHFEYVADRIAYKCQPAPRPRPGAA
jgi:hypothetical protein